MVNGHSSAYRQVSYLAFWLLGLLILPHRYTDPEGAITSLSFSPKRNLLAYTTIAGTFTRWTDPIPSELPSPTTTEAAQAKKLEKILDDDFGFGEEDGDLDMEERGEDLFGDMEAERGLEGEDDWIVDDDGGYGKDEGEERWGKGRTEVGKWL
jgi:chromosome transmission fidelity protein 4